jgi:guanosine-3',5'-bis(diphosphate) 3'-pyrophosphohydrolase
MLLKAILYAMKKHEGQKRIGGEPYITHPIAVAMMLEQKGFDKDYILAGLFHDLLEDTDATEEEILFYSNERVLKAVKVLTKIKGEEMKTYMQRVLQEHITKMVKLADRLHNLQSAKVASEKFRRRYIKETEEYYLDLAKGTPFEAEIIQALEELKATLA